MACYGLAEWLSADLVDPVMPARATYHIRTLVYCLRNVSHVKTSIMLRDIERIENMTPTNFVIVVQGPHGLVGLVTAYGGIDLVNISSGNGLLLKAALSHCLNWCRLIIIKVQWYPSGANELNHLNIFADMFNMLISTIKLRSHWQLDQT